MCRRCIINRGQADSLELLMPNPDAMKTHIDEVEKLSHAIAAALMVPREYLEPTLTAYSSVLVKADKKP